MGETNREVDLLEAVGKDSGKPRRAAEICNTAFGHTSQVAKEVPSRFEANHDRPLFYRLKKCLLLVILRVSEAPNLADVWGST